VPSAGTAAAPHATVVRAFSRRATATENGEADTGEDASATHAEVPALRASHESSFPLANPGLTAGAIT